MLDQDQVNTLKDELIATMKELCMTLNISVPSVVATRRQRGCYYPQKQLINIGRINLGSADMLRQVFVHELAHHVDHQVNKEEWTNRTYSRRTRTSHDRKFYRTLLTVIEKFYSSTSAYQWKWEYKSLMTWARYAGITADRPSPKSHELLRDCITAERVAAERGDA